MSKKTRTDILREEVVIPKVVRQKADAAFEMILVESGAGKAIRLRQRRRKRYAAAAAVAALLLSTVWNGTLRLRKSKRGRRRALVWQGFLTCPWRIRASS